MTNKYLVWALVMTSSLVLILGAYVLGLRQAQQAGTRAISSSSAPAATVAQHPALPQSSSGQDAVDPAAKYTHFRVGNRNVKAMLADTKLVWVGTSGGIIRYDIGNDKYDLFDVNNGSLLSNGVFHISKHGGRLFVGTYGGGLSVLDLSTQTWKNYNIPQGLADQFVYDVEWTTQGDMWIATWSGANLVKGGQMDDPKNWQSFNLKNTRGGLPNDWVYGLEIDAKGGVWFATEAGLAKYAGGQWTHWQHAQGLGAPFELVKNDIQFTNDPSQASKHHAQQKEQQGLSRVNVAYNPNYVVALKVDHQGNVWCGTWGGGLARFDGKQFKNYTMKDGLPANHVFALYRDSRDVLWIGTSHGLAKYHVTEDKFSVYTKNDGLFADNIFSMSAADDGSLWVGSFGGVARLAKVP